MRTYAGLHFAGFQKRGCCMVVGVPPHVVPGSSGCTDMSPEKPLTLKGTHAGRCQLSKMFFLEEKQNSAIRFSQIKDVRDRDPMVQDKAGHAVLCILLGFPFLLNDLTEGSHNPLSVPSFVWKS